MDPVQLLQGSIKKFECTNIFSAILRTLSVLPSRKPNFHVQIKVPASNLPYREFVMARFKFTHPEAPLFKSKPLSEPLSSHDSRVAKSGSSPIPGASYALLTHSVPAACYTLDRAMISITVTNAGRAAKSAFNALRSRAKNKQPSMRHVEA